MSKRWRRLERDFATFYFHSDPETYFSSFEGFKGVRAWRRSEDLAAARKA